MSDEKPPTVELAKEKVTAAFASMTKACDHMKQHAQGPALLAVAESVNELTIAVAALCVVLSRQGEP